MAIASFPSMFRKKRDRHLTASIILIIASSGATSEASNSASYYAPSLNFEAFEIPRSLEPHHVNFCENFAVDYFYRLTKESETVRANSSSGKLLTYEKKEWSEQGGLIALAWAVSEAGWKLGWATTNNNYWGLGGATHFMKFTSFTEAYSYKLLLMKYGSEFRARAGHSGWPNFLEILESGRTASFNQINESLRSGPYCEEGGPYNHDIDNKTGRCIDYAQKVVKSGVKAIKSVCGAVFETSLIKCASDREGLTDKVNVVYTSDELKKLPPKCERMKILNDALTQNPI